MYWEDVPGSRRASYLDLCLETIERHAPTPPVVLGPDDVARWVTIDRERWEQLGRPVFRSDYLRSRLLYEHGGLWLDIDTVAVAPLERLFDALGSHEVVGFGREAGGRLFPGVMAAKPGAAVCKLWMAAQDEVLDCEGITSYGALGQAITRTMSDQAGAWPLKQMAPVMYWEWRRFASHIESPAAVMAADPFLIVLWNKVMGPRFGHLTREEMLTGGSLLSQLFRVGLGRSTAAEETTAFAHLAPVNRLRFSKLGRDIEARVRRETGF